MCYVSTNLIMNRAKAVSVHWYEGGGERYHANIYRVESSLNNVAVPGQDIGYNRNVTILIDVSDADQI